MKQTAVEWLAKEICYISIDGKYIVDNAEDVTHIVEQAKEMEREQIEDAYGHGQNNGYMYANQKAITIRKDQYYDQTFKSE